MHANDQIEGNLEVSMYHMCVCVYILIWQQHTYIYINTHTHKKNQKQGGIQFVGQVQGLIDDVPTVQALVTRVLREAEEIHQKQEKELFRK
jgi:NAD(P)H-dependent flavin oxidoreductase YrpB (nitropropane dioxygenase family)